MFAQMGEFLNLISVKLSWSSARLLESKVTCIHKNREEEGCLYFRNVRNDGGLDVNVFFSCSFLIIILHLPEMLKINISL